VGSVSSLLKPYGQVTMTHFIRQLNFISRRTDGCNTFHFILTEIKTPEEDIKYDTAIFKLLQGANDSKDGALEPKNEDCLLTCEVEMSLI
jgi:hypothetical protein